MEGEQVRCSSDAQSTFLGRVLNELNDFVSVWDVNATVIYANKNLEGLWGQVPDEYRGKTVEQMGFQQKNAALLRRGIERVVATGKPTVGDMHIVDARGCERDVEFVFSPLTSEGGELECITCVSRDVTARVKAQRELCESEARFRSLAELSPDAILVNVAGTFVYANPAAVRMCQASNEADLIGKSPFDFVDKESHPLLEKRARQVVEGERVCDLVEYKWRRLDGVVIDVEALAAPIKWGGQPAGQIIVRDISERKKAEAALRDAARSKDEFLATLSHELRNPLAAIASGLELMKLAEFDPRILEDIYETLYRQTRQLVHLVDDLFEMSRITQGKLTLKKRPVKLSEIVTSSVEASQSLINEAHHKLVLELPDEPILLEADPHRLAQVLSNLLTNAARYTPAGGEIRLSAAVKHGELMIHVSDTGVGIPKDKQKAIFEKFTQLGQSSAVVCVGLGLGLSVAKSLVELHQGSIEVKSAGSGKGSTFTVHLPNVRRS